jgi:hypothetical protein
MTDDGRKVRLEVLYGRGGVLDDEVPLLHVALHELHQTRYLSSSAIRT